MSILSRHPETELEYWSAIEQLGGYIWRIEHDLANGRISGVGLAKSVEEARTIQHQLATEIAETYGVVQGAPRYYPHDARPDDYPDPPAGKTWYWDWYYRRKREAWREDYEAAPCSQCPYCRGGLDGFAFSSSLPCDLFPGMLNRLSPPWQCAITSTDFGGPIMPEHALLAKMRDEHGEDVAAAWKEKADALRSSAT